MSSEAHRFLMDSIEARRNARWMLHSGLPGRVIAFKASMRRAISKWRQYVEAIRS